MIDPAPDRTRRKQTWLIALPLIGVVIAVLAAIGPVGDPDTFWHLAAGRWVLDGGSFTGPDPFGAMAIRDWTLHEWLPEVVFSLVDQMFGFRAVGLLLPIGITLVGIAVVVACRQRAGLVVTALVVLLAMTAMNASLSLRPHLVTFGLSAVFTAAWMRTADDLRARWWLVPLTWVWACSHGMWFLGPVLGLAVITGMALERRGDLRRVLRLSTIPLLSILAASVTPSGPALLLSPLHVSETTAYIDEWRRPTFDDIGFVAFVALIAVYLIASLGAKPRWRWVHLSLLLVSSVLALSYLRTVPISAAIAAPVVADVLQARLHRAPEPPTTAERLGRLVASMGVVLVAGVLGWGMWNKPANVPTHLDNAIAALPRGTVVCNAYNYGGWLMWRHRNVVPTIDGRIEIYSADHLRSYLRFARVDPGWERYLAETKCTHAILANDIRAGKALQNRLGWNRIAGADGAVLLVRPPVTGGTS